MSTTLPTTLSTTTPTTILAGDIGGTKTAVAVFESRDELLEPVVDATFASAEYASLDAILRRFLADHPDLNVDAACFGVAGPVVDARANVTNLPWSVSEVQLGHTLRVRCATLLNDLEAAAHGLRDLAPAQRVTLNAGLEDRVGNLALVAPGTGLGEALLIWDGTRYHAVASEGGHSSFAPRDDEQIELLRFLQTGFGNHISIERVLSGPGLVNLYRFARLRSGQTEPGWISEKMAHEDPSAVIAKLALNSSDEACGDALRLFVSIYGAVAGDIALTGLTLGGVYLSGGISPKILPALKGRDFMDAFTDKGRFAELLEGIPVHVATDPELPLLGAARHALSRFQSMA